MLLDELLDELQVELPVRFLDKTAIKVYFSDGFQKR